MRSLADIHTGGSASMPRRRSGRTWRHNARFVLDPRQHYRPLDRNQRARVIALAEAIERRTKGKGQRCGFLGATGLTVLRALVFGFLGKDGRCEPSYRHLMRMTGLARATVAKALRALEALRLLTIVRRLVRKRITRDSPITGNPETIMTTVQAPNLYAIELPPGRFVPIPRKPSAAAEQDNHLGVFKVPMWARLMPCS